MSTPVVSVVVPAHNEEASIEAVVRDVACHVVAALGGARAVEMIVVDDASTDGTPAVLDRLVAEFEWLRVVHLETNVGHGPAVATGLHRARGRWLFQLDADCQFLVEDFGLLWAQRDTSNLVLGVRADRRDARHRRALSKLAAAFTSALAGQRLRDANTPFRIFRRFLWLEVAAAVGPAPALPSVATCVTAGRLGLAIAEVDVTHLARVHGRSALNLRRLVPLVLRGAIELGGATVRVPKTVAPVEGRASVRR